MDTTLQTLMENLFTVLSKNAKFQSNADWLREALFSVPRHLFIETYYDAEAPEGITKVASPHPTLTQLETIYANRGLMIRKEPHSAASQPSLIFGMLDDLQLDRGHKVLEIGTGSAWNAGLMAFRVGDDSRVYSVDLQADLVERAREHLNAVGFGRVNLKVGDGGLGWEGEMFDRIIVTVGAADIPPAWLESLADDGILLMPLKTRGVGDPILRLHKQGDTLTGRITRWAGFMNLQGKFRSASEDMLEPPWDPIVDSLLQMEPQSVLLPMIFSGDCGFWLRLNGEPMQTFLEYKAQRGVFPVRLDRELPALYVPQSGYTPIPAERMDVYGDPRHVETFINGITEWIHLGQPKITDYAIEVVGPAVSNAAAPHSYIDERPHARLRFSLPEMPIVRNQN